MSLTLRLLLIIVPLIVQLFLVMRIKKLKMKAEDALFWLLISVILVVLGIFPVIPISIASLLGIQSPANFIFLVTIALLLLKVFSLSTKVSILERRLQNLTQDFAVKNEVKNQKDN